ncbi:MAG: mechanosensitive ion channel family protein [Muribaculaceae bacterium]
MINEYVNIAIEYIRSGLAGTPNTVLNLVFALIFGALSAITYWITKWIMVGVEKLVAYTETTWDDDLLTTPLLSRISMLSPGFLAMYLLPKFYCQTPNFFDPIIHIYLAVIICWILSIFLSNLYNALRIRENFRVYAIKGVFQMVRLIIYCITAIILVSAMVGRSPMSILAALGGLAAVMMLVFKDTILGLVASVQITANHMLKKDDWIIMDSHGANGEVTDISLTTIRVKNWDNSITHIPPYAIVSESFRNYQNMRNEGGRRVYRSILIDLNSVKFLSKEKRQALADQGFVPENAAGITTNIGLLRAYLEHKIDTDERVVKDMLHMVRQMEPTASGLPLQIYFFTSATAWKEFEQVQSDFFDEVFATVHLFELRMFQAPAGADLKSLVPHKP